MAGVFRVGVVGLLHKSSSKALVKASIPAVIQSCSISGKIVRTANNIQRPAPYDYKNKKYTWINSVFDKTTKRFDDNSKIIVVEGQIASGKAAFAKELADDLDMMYMPAPTMDDIYIAPYGYDLRQLDKDLPEDVRSFDVTNFLKTPNAKNVAQFQIRMLMLRYSRYVDALGHLLSTGQGVVCNRCPFSDYVFLETMHKNGYLSSTVRSIYYDLRNHTITEILKPHLVVYLDVPVKKTIENIKKRGLGHETQSKVLNEKYLNDIEQVYKQRYLKDITQHAELLVYDWSEGGDTEVVVEDIERIDFDRFDHYDPKMQDWRIMYEEDWCERRMQYTSYKADIMNYFNVPRFDAPELMTDPDDYEKWYEAWFNAPGMKYAYGYNADCGDTGILTKDKRHSGLFISD